MKTITDYIEESKQSFRIKSHLKKEEIEYKYKPKTRKELIRIIKSEIKQGNTDLNCIDTSEITDMWQLFDQYNSEMCKLTEEQQKTLDISKWNTSNVTIMNSLFNYCKYFNGNITNWDVSNVEYASYMFRGCKEFKQNLNGWNMTKLSNSNIMFEDSGLEGNEPAWYKK